MANNLSNKLEFSTIFSSLDLEEKLKRFSNLMHKMIHYIVQIREANTTRTLSYGLFNKILSFLEDTATKFFKLLIADLNGLGTEK